MRDFVTGYMDKALFNLPEVIEQARADFASEQAADLRFDTIVGTGFSGSVVVPMLARALEVDFLLVRKPNDGSHHNGRLLGRLGQRWLFVDDFISSGATHERVRAEVAEASLDRNLVTREVGTYSYAWDGPVTNRLKITSD